MALSRPGLWTARSWSGPEIQNPLRYKAFAMDYRQTPVGIGGGTRALEQRGGARLYIADLMRMPTVFNGFINVSSKLDALALFFARLLSGSLKEDAKRDLNMQKLTRQMMQSLEKRLKTTIPWAGALHDDHTDIRHVHILAAIPRRLQKYELESLIREASTICQEQRRELEPGLERAEWRETAKQPRTTYQSLKFSKRHSMPLKRQDQTRKPLVLAGGGSSTKTHASCTCPHCHFPQSHNSQGPHNCVSCGWTLHKKRELTLQRKGREWERSL